MDSYSLFALIFAALILLSVLFAFRRHQRKQQEAILAVELEKEDFRQLELLRVQNPSQQDEQAYKLIEEERQKVWTSLTLETSLAPKKIWFMSFDLVKAIAGIYHPDIEEPQYQASIAQLSELNERIILRLQDYLEEFPLNTIKDVSIQDVLHYKQLFEKVKNFELVQFARKYKYVYDVGQYAWMGFNALNPWFWGRKAAYTAGKEGSYRYLLSVILTVVGEEAVLVYSKRQIRKQVMAVEKNIAFEMINMAVVNNSISSAEYEIILNFIIKNPNFDDRVKVSLVKALQRKRPISVALPPEPYDEKQKKRLLTEVERVAKADKLSLLKKREQLKNLENALDLTSGLRTKLEVVPPEETHSYDLVEQKRRKEDAALRLFTQAASLDGDFPAPIREHIIQRAANYPRPFNEQEQATILREALVPSDLDSLTAHIVSQDDKERVLSDMLDALLWNLPFTRAKEEFYTQVVAALDLKKISDKLLHKRLERLLPSEKLIEKPPFTVLKPLFRLLREQEQILALQQTATSYQFVTEGAKPKKKDAPYWLCVTSERVLLTAALMIDKTLYHHHLEFGQGLNVEIEDGRISDTYILRDSRQEIHLAHPLFKSSKLKQAFAAYLKD